MKVKPSVKPICDKCKVIRRHGRVMVICADRGKRRAGHSSTATSSASTTQHALTSPHRRGDPRSEAGALPGQEGTVPRIDLRKSKGSSPPDGTPCRRRPPPREAAGDRAHLHLRHRPYPRAADARRDRRLPDVRVKDLADDDLVKLRDWIDANYKVEGDLRREVAADIRRKIEIGCYQGIRHRRGLPVHGQRTHTNARTRKGPKKTVAGKKKPKK